MKVIVAGSRTIKDFEVVREAIRRAMIWGITPTEIVSGCARGVDTLAIQYAETYGIPYKKFPAEWDKYGQKRAGLIRNRVMAEYADALIAVWDGESTGTKHMIDTALGIGLEVVCYFPKNRDLHIYR